VTSKPYKMLCKRILALSWALSVASHGDHEHQKAVSGPLDSIWYNTLPGDGGTQVKTPSRGSS